jgi:hypothetical protein
MIILIHNLSTSPQTISSKYFASMPLLVAGFGLCFLPFYLLRSGGFQ